MATNRLTHLLGVPEPILIGTSQLLGLSFLVYLVLKAQYRLVPYAFAVICSMPFVL